MDYQYQFIHKKSGKKVIAQSWNEFWKMQSSSDYDSSYKYPGREGYQSEVHWQNCNGILAKIEEKVNKFWQGAKGFEKVGQINCNGWTFNPIKIVLKNIHNHACMMGDLETVQKVKKASFKVYPALPPAQ